MRCAWPGRRGLALLLVLASCAAPERTAPPAPIVERRLDAVAGSIVEDRLSHGETRAYLLPMAAGWFAGVTVEQRGIDLAVRLRGPDGRIRAEVDSPNGSRGPEPMPFVADVPGVWRLEVRPSSPGDISGGFSVRIDALHPATIADRARVEAERLLAGATALRQREDRASLRQSLERARRAAARLESLGDGGRAADALYSAAESLYSLDDYAASQAAFEKALDLYRQAGRNGDAAKALNALGRGCRALGEPETAIGRYREALALARRIGDREQEAVTLLNLGWVYQSLGETERALDGFEQSLPVWRELGRPADEAATLLAQGYLYQSVGEPEKALDVLPRALALFESQGASRDAARVLNTLGNAQAKAGDVNGALASLRRAQAIRRRLGDRRGEGETLNDLGWCQILQGRPSEARASFAAAVKAFREVRDATGEAAALSSLGWADGELGRARPALASFERSLPVLRSAGLRDKEAMALLGIARSRRALGDLEAARQAAESALVLIESLRGKPASLDMRAAFLATKQSFYELTIDLLMAAGDPARALAVSERSRARSLLDWLGGSDAPSAGKSTRPLTLPEIQRQVADSGTVLLEYSLGKERSFLWAVTPGSLDSFELAPRAAIEQAARRAAGLLAVSHQTLARGRAQEALADLSRLLLAPAAGRLDGKRLVIVPDGALHYIPFAALPEPGGGGPVVARHEVVTLPSASSLAALRKETSRRPERTLAVVADPVFDAAGLAGLPFSRDEAEALLALAPPGQRLAALGFDASRETVLSGRLSGYRLVHFATHGILDEDHPELSGLLLSDLDAQGHRRDGFLGAHEIARLRLPADLVVLSACRTALGKEIRGEGLVGLTRGFFHAGARSVLVSLWEVEDRATAELMRRFYREMLRGGRPPAAALRAAQDSLRREPGREAPYFWAGFVLQGDWRPR